MRFKKYFPKPSGNVIINNLLTFCFFLKFSIKMLVLSKKLNVMVALYYYLYLISKSMGINQVLKGQIIIK